MKAKNNMLISSGHWTKEEIIKRSGNLPAFHIADEVNQRLQEHASLVVTAPPGAGKSTLLPLTILLGMKSRGKILMLEPRRIAAKQIAERMAHILGESVGKTVGYRIRFDNKTSSSTQIEVLTEGILSKMLIDDATLDGVSVVIFDEFHERSIHSDLALALTRQAQQLIRPDLKIIVMSATIDTTPICQFLQAPLIESEGKMYPVTIIHSEDNLHPSQCAQAVSTAIMKAYREHDGSILAFLPGQGEIEKCQELLQTSLPHIYPLYGNLAPELQQQAIAPSPTGERKVVLATPIAETSLTIEGVRIVVDSGLYRHPVFDNRTGLSHLETVHISMDMATQRSGRAGRLTEGICYRLWTLASEHQMAEQRKAEIEETDLAPMLLGIYAFGENDAISLPWLTPPPTGNIIKAQKLLESLGAIHQNTITSLGKKMAQLPCHPRISKMILSADNPAQKSLACDIAALLEEKDPMTDIGESDMSIRISTFRFLRKKKSLGKWSRIAKIAQEYHKMVKTEEDNADIAPEDIGQLVAHAYPERIGMSIDNMGNFKLAGGDNVHIDTSDAMSAHKWIAVASLFTGVSNSSSHSGHVFLAAPLNIKKLEQAPANDLITERNNLTWDSKQGMVVMQREQRIGKLIVSSKPIHNANPTDIVKIVCEAIKKEGLSMLDWNDQAQQLQRRVAQVDLWHPELNLPDISTPTLMNTAQEWLPFYLEQGEKIKSSTAELKKINLQEVLWALIPYELQQEIDKLAPTHIQVPTGSRIRVDYRLGAEAPVLSVRLQECFGLAETPCLNGGKQPVLMELLSPGFKPVQLTQDLNSFWHGTYFEVRKELKRRYPKHYWPENPWEAEAVRGVKR